MFVQTLVGFEKTLGPEHGNTIIARRSLINFKNTQKSKTQ